MKVGSKLICVSAIYNPTPDLGVVVPKFKHIYTVRFIQENLYGMPGVWIRLEEIVNPVLNYTEMIDEAAFNANCFREIEPEEGDISELVEILEKRSV